LGACDKTAQPGTWTATSIENTNRAGAGSTQVGQFRLKESPDPPVGICVQAIEGKQAPRIAIGIDDVITTSLIVGSRDVRICTVANHWIRIADLISAEQILSPCSIEN
jgi:hypothetical protein